MFGPSRADVAPIEIIAAAAATSQTAADPIPADRYNFELRVRNIAIAVPSRVIAGCSRSNLPRFVQNGTRGSWRFFRSAFE